jgi:hypothetical protein
MNVRVDMRKYCIRRSIGRCGHLDGARALRRFDQLCYSSVFLCTVFPYMYIFCVPVLLTVHRRRVGYFEALLGNAPNGCKIWEV